MDSRTCSLVQPLSAISLWIFQANLISSEISRQMAVVLSETRVFVSQDPLSKPPPRGPTLAPPKTLVNLLMKVDFPHPESAATPMTITFSPSLRAMSTVVVVLECILVRPVYPTGEKATVAVKDKRVTNACNITY